MNRTGTRTVAALLCALYLVMSACAVAFADPAYYERSLVTPGSTARPGNVLWSHYNLYDNQPAVRPVNSGRTLADSATALTNGLADGDMNASKDGYFATDEDAQNGVVKLVFDVVGKPPSEAADVMLILDESGSMTMYSEPPVPPDTATQYEYAVPCLNENHYYDVSYHLTSNQGESFFYRFKPSACRNVNVWENQDFIDEIKDMIAADDHVPRNQIIMDHWYDGWDFGNHHYDAAGNQILKDRGSHDPNLGGSNTGAYYSPSFTNRDQCIDRQMIAKQALRTMITTAQTSNAQSRFGLVTFAGVLSNSWDLMDRSAIQALSDQTIPGLLQLNGYDNTNYEAAFTKAYDILDATPKPLGRKTVVLFMTDGMPNAGNTTVAESKASSIKNIANTTLYCVGIKAAATPLLTRMASPGCFWECDTQEQLEAFLGSLTTEISGRSSVVVDALGDNYDIVCDSAHPISIQDGSKPQAQQTTDYNTVAKAGAAGVAYDSTTGTVTWNVSGATAQGIRLSFYVKLDESVYLSNLANSEGSYPTNKGDAAMTYIKIDPDHPGDPGSAAIRTMPNPATIRVEQSRLTAVKTVDRPNETVLPNEELTYTIALRNSGKFDFAGVKVSDAIPVGTEYMPASGGTLDANNKVNFDIANVAKDSTERVSFKVKVLPGDNRIENYAMFGTSDVAASLRNGAPVCYANLVVNPRPGQPVPPTPPAPTTPPKTGDEAQPLWWVALLVLAAAGCVGLVYGIRKKRKAKN